MRFAVRNDGPEFLDDLQVVIEFDDPAISLLEKPPPQGAVLETPAEWGAFNGALEVSGRWWATARKLDSVVDGEIAMTLANEAVDVAALLTAPRGD